MQSQHMPNPNTDSAARTSRRDQPSTGSSFLTREATPEPQPQAQQARAPAAPAAQAEGERDDDWLSLLHNCVSFLVLFSIIYYYSSPERFIVIFSIVSILIM